MSVSFAFMRLLKRRFENPVSYTNKTTYSLAFSIKLKAQSQTVLVVGVAANSEEFNFRVLILALFSKALVTLLFNLCCDFSIS
jgi:hypothetical protein